MYKVTQLSTQHFLLIAFNMFCSIVLWGCCCWLYLDTRYNVRGHVSGIDILFVWWNEFKTSGIPFFKWCLQGAPLWIFWKCNLIWVGFIFHFIFIKKKSTVIQFPSKKMFKAFQMEHPSAFSLADYDGNLTSLSMGSIEFKNMKVRGPLGFFQG